MNNNQDRPPLRSVPSWEVTANGARTTIGRVQPVAAVISALCSSIASRRPHCAPGSGAHANTVSSRTGSHAPRVHVGLGLGRDSSPSGFWLALVDVPRPVALRHAPLSNARWYVQVRTDNQTGIWILAICLLLTLPRPGFSHLWNKGSGLISIIKHFDKSWYNDAKHSVPAWYQFCQMQLHMGNHAPGVKLFLTFLRFCCQTSGNKNLKCGRKSKAHHHFKSLFYSNIKWSSNAVLS